MEEVKCALCLTENATKKNTHYLTDALIRKCVNEDGNKGRERGYYGRMGQSPFPKFGFQRSTSVEKIEEAYGRPPSEDEIEQAKNNIHSVDNVFCNSCEKKFGEIENDFMEKVYPIIVDAHDSDLSMIELEDIDCSRLFFLLQVWRASVCTQMFDIDKTTQECLRITFDAFPEHNQHDLRSYPISLSLLQTKAEQQGQNATGLSSDVDPVVVMLCDIILQFYSDTKNIRFISFHSINEERNYKSLISTGNDPIKIKILSDARRMKFLEDYHMKNTVKPFIDALTSQFAKHYCRIFQTNPSKKQINEFIPSIISKAAKKNVMVRYDEENVNDYIREYFEEKYNTF
jgi:hypothetical protein